MEKVLDLVSRVAQVDATVLITGESGVGKERIARMVHDTSPRARGDFIEFASAKSPYLQCKLMQVGDRMLVDWHDDSVDAEAWLDFTPGQRAGSMTLAMSKVDPDADFSYDYEDLAFERIGKCP